MHTWQHCGQKFNFLFTALMWIFHRGSATFHLQSAIYNSLVTKNNKNLPKNSISLTDEIRNT